jgi:hypothetical protein
MEYFGTGKVSAWRRFRFTICCYPDGTDEKDSQVAYEPFDKKDGPEKQKVGHSPKIPAWYQTSKQCSVPVLKKLQPG